MAGTKAGGAKAALSNKSKYGEDFYRQIGKEGGKTRHPNKGFGGDRQRAREEGARGGAISRRGPKKGMINGRI